MALLRRLFLCACFSFRASIIGPIRTNDTTFLSQIKPLIMHRVSDHREQEHLMNIGTLIRLACFNSMEKNNMLNEEKKRKHFVGLLGKIGYDHKYYARHNKNFICRVVGR